MRELKTSEVEAVSGAGIIADMSAGIGNAIGNVVDSAAALFGKTTTFASISAQMGKGIGQFFELNFSAAMDNLQTSVSDMVGAITSFFSSSDTKL